MDRYKLAVISLLILIAGLVGGVFWSLHHEPGISEADIARLRDKCLEQTISVLVSGASSSLSACKELERHR